MNVFEDLLEELKEEHLLEQTVEITDEKKTPRSKAPETEFLEIPSVANRRPANPQTLDTANDLTVEEILEAEKFLEQLEAESQNQAPAESSPPNTSQTHVLLDSINPPPVFDEPENPNPKQRLSEFEFFRKRAMEEVSSLQMVDNIFSSVEREQMKISPKPFDDLPVKKVLHSFLQVPNSVSLNEHAEAEFELRQGTESWYSALAERDEQISVENLRYCCETTRPPLSPPALLALAKFYRNAPFSEDGRNKFDLLITRLFSRDIEDDRRELVFTHEDLSGHLGELYAEWESIAFYPTDEKDEEITLNLLKFEDFIMEAKRADSFDDLIKTEFFNRVRAFKRSCGETFYAPQIAAMSIICNVKVGNRYVDLLEAERGTTFEEAIDEKYGFIFEQSVAASTNKSLQLAELLREHKEKSKIFDLDDIERRRNGKHKPHNSKNKQKTSAENSIVQSLQSVNKGLLAAALLTIILSAGLYFWVEVLSAPPKISEEVRQIQLDETRFKEFIESARISNDTLFAIGTSVWNTLPIEKKEEILGALLAEGKTKNYKKVHLVDKQGLSIGSATQNKIELK